MKQNALKAFSVVGLSTTLWNPTNEQMDMQYSGHSFSLMPGEKWEGMEINCAKHVLNAYGQRGLTSLNYGDDEEKIKADAIQRNLDFKKKQVLEHNTRNEQKRQMGLAWIPPTAKIRSYADELGVELMEPAPLKEKTVNVDPEIARLRDENREMKDRMDKLMGMIESLAKPDKPPDVKSGK